jgi:chromosome segregation ATPase
VRLFSNKDKNVRAASSTAKVPAAFDSQKQFDIFYDFFISTCLISGDDDTVSFAREKADAILKVILNDFCKAEEIEEEAAKVKFLSQKRSGISSTLLHIAAVKKSVDAINWLRSKGLTIEGDDGNTLHHISSQRDSTIARAALDSSSNPGLRQSLEFERAQQEERIGKLNETLTTAKEMAAKKTAGLLEKQKQLEELTQTTASVASENSQLQLQLGEKTELLNEKEKIIAQQSATQTQSVGKNAALQRRIAELEQTAERERDENSQQSAAAATQQRQLEERVQVLSKERGEIVAKQTNQIAQLQRRQAELESQLQVQTDATQSATALADTKTVGLGQLQQTHAETQQQLTQAQQQLAKANASNTEFETQLQIQTDATRHARVTVDTKTAELEQLKQTHKATEQQLAATATESEQFKEKVLAAIQQIEQQQQTILQQTAAHADLATQHSGLQERNSKLETQLQTQTDATKAATTTSETAATNLQQVQQILAAKEQALAQLQLQLADAATRQQQLQASIAALSNEKGEIVATQTSQITELQTKQATLERQLREQTDTTANVTAAVASRTTELATVTNELEQFKTKYAGLEEQNEKLRQTILQQTAAHADLAMQRSSLQARNNELETLLGNQTAAANAATMTNEKTAADLQQAQRTSTQQQQQLADVATTQRNLQTRIATLSSEKDEIVTAQAKQITELNAKQVALERQLQEQTDATKNTMAINKTTAAALQQAQQLLATKEQELATASTEATQLKNDVAQTKQQVEQQQQTIQQQTNAQADTEKQHAALQRLLEEVSKEKTRLTSELEKTTRAAKKYKKNQSLLASRISTLEEDTEQKIHQLEGLKTKLTAKTKEYSDLRRKVHRSKKKKLSIGEQHDIELPDAPYFQRLPVGCSDVFRKVIFNIAEKGDSHELMLLLPLVGADVFTDEKRGSLLSAAVLGRNVESARLIRGFTYKQNTITAAYEKFQQHVAATIATSNNTEGLTRLLLPAFEHPFYKNFMVKKYQSLKTDLEDYFYANAWIDGITLLHLAARQEDPDLIRIALGMGIDIEVETLEDDAVTVCDILLQRGKHTDNLPACFAILVDHQPLHFSKTRITKLLNQKWIQPDTKQAIEAKLQEPSAERQVNHLLHYLNVKYYLTTISDDEQKARLKKLFQAYQTQMTIFLPQQTPNSYEVRPTQQADDKKFIEKTLAEDDIDENEKICCETLMLYIDPYVAQYKPADITNCRKRHSHALAELIQQIISSENGQLLEILFESKELFTATSGNPIDLLSLKIEDKDILEYVIDKHAYSFIELLFLYYPEKLTSTLIKKLINYAMDKHAYPLIDTLLKKNKLTDDDKKELIKQAVPTEVGRKSYPLVALQLVQTVTDKDIKKKYTERVFAATDSFGNAAIHLAIKFISPSSVSFIVNQGETVRNQEFNKIDGCGNSVLDLYRYLEDLKKCVNETLKADINNIQKLILNTNHSDIKTFHLAQGSASSMMFQQPPATPRSNHAALGSPATSPHKPSANDQHSVDDDDDTSESVSVSDSISLSESASVSTSQRHHTESRRPPSTPKN